MRALIDTAILIDHLRGVPAAVALLESLIVQGVELWSVTVVRTEVFAGMKDAERQATETLLAVLRWQDVTVDIADQAGDLARRYLPSFRGVDTIDFVIAAAAIGLNADLITVNIKHFPMFPQLKKAY